MNLGQRVRQLRGQISQKDFAKLCGIADSTICKIENGSLTGTLEIHRKICQALKISLSTFYKGVYEDDVRPIESAPAEEKPFYYNDRSTSQFLTRNIFLNKKMLPEVLVLEPEGQAQDELPADTQRFLYVLEGEVEIKVGDTSCTLKTTGTLYVVDASLPHSVKNTGQSTAKVLRVTSPVRL